MGSEQGKFDIADVINSLCQKLIYRHPHVFGDEKANSAETVLQNWEQLKLKEKGRKPSVLSGVPKSLPALVKAYRIQDKTHSVGFDWPEREQVWAKVEEELQEFKTELQADTSSKATESEFGDLLFSLVNAARLYKINPENALDSTNLKFISRFNYLEEQIKENGKTLKDTTLEEMDQLWNEAKKVVG
jgi:XTP/dITP diphosphohydrolase